MLVGDEVTCDTRRGSPPRSLPRRLQLADFAASLSSGCDADKLQAVLEEKDPEQRLHKTLILLSKEREVSKQHK